MGQGVLFEGLVEGFIKNLGILQLIINLFLGLDLIQALPQGFLGLFGNLKLQIKVSHENRGLRADQVVRVKGHDAL